MIIWYVLICIFEDRLQLSKLNLSKLPRVFPLIPLFLTSVLGAGAYVVGIVEGAAETTASLLKVVSGYWSD